ncbi:hypothetical protein [Photobacterium nomapromontoriensis]|uniref:hypothetical protein n=1 Tax=Photobacterium nomapromontoriensis TaxID=2910237 RepID=UPI003D1426BF
MKKKRLLGLGMVTVMVASAGYYFTKPYFAEKARIELLAEQLEWRRGDATEWIYDTDFELPKRPKIADWNIENVALPQVLFMIANPDDESQVSYWALNIDGTNPQLLIPEGVLPPTPCSGTIDYGIYMSRSPNGRYLIIPQEEGTVLYDLDNGEITPLGKVSTSIHDVMWDKDSTQVVVKKRDELILVKLDNKKVINFDEVNGPLARRAASFGQAYMNQSEQQIYLSFDNDVAGDFSCGITEEFIETFGDRGLPTCGNTFVIDAKTLKLVDRGEFTPNAYDCNVRGSKFADGFYCLGNNGGGVYRAGRPSQKVGQHFTRGYMLGLNGGDMWFTGYEQRNISRVLEKPTENSPTTKMVYTLGAVQNGKRVELSDFGFGFSRYVLEHSDTESWSDALYPLPSYRDLEKAKVVLEARD